MGISPGPVRPAGGAGLPQGYLGQKPKRKSRGGGLILTLILLLVVLLALTGMSFFAPASLAIAQERILGVARGGIVTSSEETYVDGCVRVAGADSLQAITRTERVTIFGDGTTLRIIFSSAPTPTNACG